MTRPELDEGPAGPPLPAYVDGNRIGDAVHQVNSQSVVRERVEIGLHVAGGVEGPSEILHLENQPVLAAPNRDVDGLATPALVRVLDGVGAQLAHRQHEGCPGLPLHTQPVQGLARHREAAGRRRFTLWPGHALMPTWRDSV